MDVKVTSEVRCSAASVEPPQKTICDCHKKLVQFGIPLYICEENDFYAELSKAISYEKAFRLPGKLVMNEEITEYLKVEENDLPVVFQQMAEVFPALKDYEQNVLSFWILDVLIEGLWSAQTAKMGFLHQRATLLWIAYIFNFIQKENPTRKQLFRHLKVVLFQNVNNECEGEENPESLDEYTRTPTENFISTDMNWNVPLPPHACRRPSKPKTQASKKRTSEGGSSTAEEYQSEEGSNSATSAVSLDEGEQDTEKNLADMKIILEILYRIFARSYAYQHIQTVFHNMPSLERVKLPFPLKIPKTLAKPEVLSVGKGEKAGKKTSTIDKFSDEAEAEKQLIRNNYILPLEVSEEAKEYLKQQSSERSVLWRNKEDKAKK